MNVGGVTDTISHFVGLMRLYDAPEVSRIILDDPAYTKPLRPWAPDLAHQTLSAPAIDPLQSSPSPLTQIPLDGLHRPTHFRPHVDHVKVLPPENGSSSPLADNPAFPYPDASGNGINLGGVTSTVMVPHPDQLSLQVVQINSLDSGDRLLMVQGHDGSFLHNDSAGHVFDQLLGSAGDDIPRDLVPASLSSSGLVGLVQAHDNAGTASFGSSGTSAPFGTYVDGVMQPEGSKVAFTAPSQAATLDTSNHNGLETPGLEAQTGQNLSINSASILDDNTAHSTTAILGNSYSTDAIFQNNILVDHSFINAFGVSATPSFLTGHDTAHNAASVQHVDLSMGGPVAGSFGAQVSIDTVPGDFYNVSVLSQVNSLADNDAVVQATHNTYYGVSTGHNTQINDVPVQELNGHYDLIVVEGSSHTANLIYQTNALLTDSAVLSMDMRQDGVSQTIATGNNSLSNMASITHYGSSAPSQFGGDLVKAISDLETGKIDPALATAIPDNGSGTVHVLLVHGDFYNINAISQVNLVTNVDTVAQYSPDPHTTTSVTGVPMTSTQSADTGGNQLANLAQIVTVGTTAGSNFVNGSHYQAATLVQAGFVNDQNHTVTGDPNSLATQLADLSGLPEAALGGVHNHAVNMASASTHDDLFHGVLS